MKTQNNLNQPSFQAKFLHSESLKQVAEYAVKKGLFDELNQARKNIEKYYIQRHLKLDVFEKEGRPVAAFTRYVPKFGIVAPKNIDEYIPARVIIFESRKTGNPLKFALYKIIEIGKNAPCNNSFKDVIIRHNILNKNYYAK